MHILIQRLRNEIQRKVRKTNLGIDQFEKYDPVKTFLLFKLQIVEYSILFP